MSTSYSLELVYVTLFGKWVFVDVIKDLKMRSLWVAQVDPKISDGCPYKGQTRRRHRH